MIGFCSLRGRPIRRQVEQCTPSINAEPLYSRNPSFLATIHAIHPREGFLAGGSNQDALIRKLNKCESENAASQANPKQGPNACRAFRAAPGARNGVSMVNSRAYAQGCRPLSMLPRLAKFIHWKTSNFLSRVDFEGDHPYDADTLLNRVGAGLASATPALLSFALC